MGGREVWRDGEDGREVGEVQRGRGWEVYIIYGEEVGMTRGGVKELVENTFVKK